MKKFLHKLKSYIHSTYLCIRFPFLYPKNRFTGKHYNNWKIQEKINKLKSEYTQHFSFHLISPNYIGIIEKHPTLSKESIIKKLVNIKNVEVRVYNDDKQVYFEIRKGCSIRVEKFSFEELFLKFNQKFTVSNVYICETRKKFFGADKESIGYSLYIETPDYVKEESDNNSNNPLTLEWVGFKSIVIDKNKNNSIIFYKVIHKFYELFHCIPSYTELIGMDTGWKKTFGIQMCKEIKHSLIYTFINKENIKPYNIFKYIKAYLKGIKLLYKYTITDIKSKYGGLRWYTTWDTNGTREIVDKYESLSYNICYICGKPADYITTGWIDPYCKDCISENQKLNAKQIVRKEDGTIEYIGPGTDEE